MAEIKRKKNTGEPGNGGQFGSKQHSEASAFLRLVDPAYEVTQFRQCGGSPVLCSDFGDGGSAGDLLVTSSWRGKTHTRTFHGVTVRDDSDGAVDAVTVTSDGEESTVHVDGSTRLYFRPGDGDAPLVPMPDELRSLKASDIPYDHDDPVVIRSGGISVNIGRDQIGSSKYVYVVERQRDIHSSVTETNFSEAKRDAQWLLSGRGWD